MNIQEIIYNHLEGGEAQYQGVKNVTVRLSYKSYAELSVLAKHLGISISGLLKELSESSISQGLGIYLSAVGNDAVCDIGPEIDEIIEDMASSEVA